MSSYAYNYEERKTHIVKSSLTLQKKKEEEKKIILQWPCKKDSPTPIGAKSTISFLVRLTFVGCRLGRNLPILFLSKPRHPLLFDCLMDVLDKELDVVRESSCGPLKHTAVRETLVHQV
jgi:hypothetical protein